MRENVTPYANSLFEQPWWLDIVAPGQWHEVFVKDKQDQVIARMPYVSDGKRIYMPDLTQNLGPWIKNREFQAGNTQLHEQKEIISELLGQLPSVRSITMTMNCANDYILPYRWNGFTYSPSFSYRINDLSNLESVYSNFNKTAKKNIRRSEKEITISNEPDIERLLNVMEATFHHQKREYPVDKSLVRKIVKTCEDTGHGRMFIAKDAEGNVHAASYLVFDEKCAYALLGGSDPAYRNSGAKSLVWWKEIEFASTVSTVFDFEGSNIEGIENFVRQFGGVCTPLYTIRKTTFLDEVWSAAKPRIKRLIGYKV